MNAAAKPELQAMQVSDLPEILRFWRQIEGIGLDDVDQPQPLERYLTRNPGMSVVARAEGKVVGAALCGHDGRRGFLHHVAVHLDWRGHGLGSRLTDWCLNRLALEGIERCHVFVYESNDAGKDFWRNLGWTPRTDLCVFTRPVPHA